MADFGDTRGLCAAVAADPWCDTTRLALADLYQESGELPAVSS